MAEDKDALIAQYESTRAAFNAAIEGLSTAQLVETSIDGWSVKDHMLHLATWDDIRSSEVERISKGFDSAWRMTEEQDEALNEMAYEIRRNLSLDQALFEFEASRSRLLSALRNATERGLDPSLYGAAGLKSGHEEEHMGWIRQWRERRGI